MKKFIYKLILFLIVPFLIIISFDTWLRNINSLYKEKYIGLQKGKDSIEVIIAGNSHATYGVDPNYFSRNAFNIANVSQSIYFDKRIILSHIDELHKLKYVFISLDNHSLYISSQGIRDVWSYYANGIRYKNKCYIMEDLSPFIFGYTPKVSMTLLKKEVMKKIKYKSIKTIDFDVQDDVEYTDSISKGFIGLTGNSNSFNKRAYLSRIKYPEPQDTIIAKEVLEDLEDLIQELKRRNVGVILFASPTFSEYNSYLNKSILKQNQKYIKYLTSKYSLEYWNYSDSTAFIQNDFLDCDHLNKVGAKKFARMLSERLETYDKMH